MAEHVARRSGWITFAGAAALIAGGCNTLSGIAALADDDTLASQASEVLYGIDLTAWGWFWLLLGLLQLLAGGGILGRNMWALWLGVGIAGASAFSQSSSCSFFHSGRSPCSRSTSSSSTGC